MRSLYWLFPSCSLLVKPKSKCLDLTCPSFMLHWQKGCPYRSPVLGQHQLLAGLSSGEVSGSIVRPSPHFRPSSLKSYLPLEDDTERQSAQILSLIRHKFVDRVIKNGPRSVFCPKHLLCRAARPPPAATRVGFSINLKSSTVWRTSPGVWVAQGCGGLCFIVVL